ncbi:MAG TPA: DUF192 domain-containing protein [Gemmatimonadales bacterium]|nr:DUF192 domain-containing protein [Gemmatimonadales bacterium]
MRRVAVRRADGAPVAMAVGLADSAWLRLRGMLGRPAPGREEGMLLLPCRAVHMWGMRYPLDVAFLDAEGQVVAAYPDLAPGARTKLHREARAALELAPGTLARSGTRVGHRLEWQEVG